MTFLMISVQQLMLILVVCSLFFGFTSVGKGAANIVKGVKKVNKEKDEVLKPLKDINKELKKSHRL